MKKLIQTLHGGKGPGSAWPHRVTREEEAMLRFRPMPGILVPLVLVWLCAGTAVGEYVSPQTQALDALRANAYASDPVRVRFQAGFPISVSCRHPVNGSDPVQQAKDFLDQYAALYHQDHPEVELIFVQSENDPVEGSIVRFAQEIAGFRVFGAEIVVRIGPLDTPQHGILGTTGTLMIPAYNDELPARENAFDREAAITIEMAEDAARTAAGNPAAGVRGGSLLMIYEPAVFGEAPGPRLAYRVTLDDGSQYLIDAHTSESLLEHGITKDSSGLNDYELDLEDANGATAESTNCYNPTTIDDDIGDEDGLEISYHTDPDAVTAWWAARRTYETFHDEFSRHSFDDAAAEIVAYVHVGFNNPAANAVPGCGLQFGDGSISDDVMGHEFTHLVIDEESGLVYANQSGALNESLADVLGTAVDPDDWLIAEGTTALGTLRSLSDPPSLTIDGVAYPDRMSQFSNLGGVDNGGVHFNSSITNKAFFLIAAGGSHNGRFVSAIGRTKMHLLAYRLTKVLGANSSFNQARDTAVGIAEYWRAMGFHGYGDAEVCTVRNAFAAVELGFGDLDCDNVEDNVDDTDNDGILDDGDQSGSQFDNRCRGGDGPFCDDNCPNTSNPTQKDFDNDGNGDACDDDDDNDGIPDVVDHCPNMPGTAPDTDGDGFHDCLDGDDDNDGVEDDGDGSGDPTDNPCPPFGGGAEPLCDDNCRLDPNPMQEDGDLDGRGDACNPDYDGDGIYGGIGEGDNCPWDANPDQLDSDFDGLGDACDNCPFVFDFTGIWVGAIPELGLPPHPLQGDSDGDGDADPCDVDGTWSTYENNVYHNLNAVTAEEHTGAMEFLSDSTGAGHQVRLPFFACTTLDPDGPAPGDRVELRFTPFPDSLTGWVEDDWGRVVGRIRRAEDNLDVYGLLFRPRCDRSYTLVLRSLANFDGYEAFDVFSRAYDPAGYNPYMPSPPVFSDVPVDVADADGDGLPDSVDSCPTTYEPTNADGDGDGVGDACDNCPTAFNPLQGPAEFPTIYAYGLGGGTTQVEFRWEGEVSFRYLFGRLDQLPSYQYQSTGLETGNSYSIQASALSKYYLFRFDGDSCPGTWGSQNRDDNLP